MSQIGQCPLEPIVPPRRILPSQLNDQLRNFFRKGWSSRSLLTSITVVPLLGHQFSVPAQNGVGGKERADLLQHFASQDLSLGGQPTALIVIEQDPFLAQLFFEHVNFRPLKLDNLLLLAVYPARQNNQQELPRLQDKFHGSQLRRSGKLQHRPLASTCQQAEIRYWFTCANATLAESYESAEFFDPTRKAQAEVALSRRCLRSSKPAVNKGAIPSPSWLMQSTLTSPVVLPPSY